jgi:hypothetical protein
MSSFHARRVVALKGLSIALGFLGSLVVRNRIFLTLCVAIADFATRFCYAAVKMVRTLAGLVQLREAQPWRDGL